jgi:hypothetical protein
MLFSPRRHFASVNVFPVVVKLGLREARLALDVRRGLHMFLLAVVDRRLQIVRCGRCTAMVCSL